jgi:hypothetical protein
MKALDSILGHNTVIMIDFEELIICYLWNLFSPNLFVPFAVVKAAGIVQSV